MKFMFDDDKNQFDLFNDGHQSVEIFFMILLFGIHVLQYTNVHLYSQYVITQKYHIPLFSLFTISIWYIMKFTWIKWRFASTHHIVYSRNLVHTSTYFFASSALISTLKDFFLDKYCYFMSGLRYFKENFHSNYGWWYTMSVHMFIKMMTK